MGRVLSVGLVALLACKPGGRAAPDAAAAGASITTLGPGDAAVSDSSARAPVPVALQVDGGMVGDCIYLPGAEDDLGDGQERAASDDVRPTVTLEGEVVDIIAHHAMNGTPIPFYALVLDEPRCFHGYSEEEAQLHLRLPGSDVSPAAERSKLRPLIGRHVRVRGRTERAAPTAWWPRPILLEVESIVAIPKPAVAGARR